MAALEEERNRTRDLTDFLVHDMKDSLACNLLGSELVLTSGQFEEENTEELRRVRGSAAKLRRMTLNLLDIQLTRTTTSIRSWSQFRFLRFKPRSPVPYPR